MDLSFFVNKGWHGMDRNGHNGVQGLNLLADQHNWDKQNAESITDLNHKSYDIKTFALN